MRPQPELWVSDEQPGKTVLARVVKAPGIKTRNLAAEAAIAGKDGSWSPDVKSAAMGFGAGPAE